MAVSMCFLACIMGTWCDIYAFSGAYFWGSIRAYCYIGLYRTSLDSHTDTHRYQIIHYGKIKCILRWSISNKQTFTARKCKSRAFTVNYRYSFHSHSMMFVTADWLPFYIRKAPQYPWPCPLHDVLAACRIGLCILYSTRSADKRMLYFQISI